MIIVSNEIIKNKQGTFLSYSEFVEKAYSDEGLDMGDGIFINVNDLQEDVFGDLEGLDGVSYFTTNKNIPKFMNNVKVENWDIEIEKEIIKNDINQESQTEPEYFLDKKDEKIEDSIKDLLNCTDLDDEDYISEEQNEKEARIIVFGSSKGGTGKTFTSLISTYRYAKTHPNEKIALVDFDIIDGQVGISIHKIRPTMGRYFVEYQKGYRDFNTMKNFAVKGNNVFPQNVDFYLAPTSGSPIENEDFWFNIIKNCIENYDLVVFDTGIDYLNITPISYAYKIADKINLVTTTSIKSVNSVTKQIGRLKGEIASPGKIGETKVENVFNPDDEIAPRLNVIITQMVPTNKMNETIYSDLSKKCNVIATFGVITDSISEAEFYGHWDIFDKNAAINKYLDNIMA